MFKKYIGIIACSLFLFIGVKNIYGENIKKEEKWKTRGEFSYINTNGIKNSQIISSNIKTKKETKKVRHYMNTNIQYGEHYNKINNTYEKIMNKWVLNYRYERMFSEKLFYFSSINYIKNEFSSYYYNILAGPGCGYDIVKTKKHYLKLLLSTLYVYDNFKELENNNKEDSYSSEKAAIKYTWYISEDFLFKNNIDYLHSFKENKKYIINSETVFEIKMNNYMSLGLSYILFYENDTFSYYQSKNYTEKTFLTSIIIDL